MSSHQSHDDDDEPREYSSPACYLHEFEQQSTPQPGTGGSGKLTAPPSKQIAEPKSDHPQPEDHQAGLVSSASNPADSCEP